MGSFKACHSEESVKIGSAVKIEKNTNITRFIFLLAENNFKGFRRTEWQKPDEDNVFDILNVGINNEIGLLMQG